MNIPHYIGFDVHKKTVNYCVKTADGQIVEEGKLPALRVKLREWATARPCPWQGALEATLFSAWIYATLQPHAQQLLMGHPAKMKAITAGKKKSDRLHPLLVPECHDRIDLGGAARREVAGRQARQGHDAYHSRQRCGIVWGNAPELMGQDARGAQAQE